MATTIDKFLTPESMITPGVAGSMSMMIGNTLHYQFNVPNGWAILVLSFVFGLLVLAKSRSLVTRGVLYVLNSLVIFCMAAGAISLSADAGDNKTHASSFSLIGPVYAQQSMAELQAQYNQLSSQYETLWSQLKSAPAGTNVSPLMQSIEEVDRKRAAVLRSIEAQSRSTTTTGSGEKKFFAPLTFK